MSTKTLRLSLLVFALLAATVFSAVGETQAEQPLLPQIFKTYAPSVVRVRGAFSQTNAEGDLKVSIQVGTGFFIGTDGEVLTTATVANGADRVWIEYNRSSFPTKVLGVDPQTNVALLRVLEPPKDLHAIPLPVQTSELSIGSSIFIVSCPLECNPSAAEGYINSYDGQYGFHLFPTYHLRTSVGGHPGEGGAPVFDNRGCLIGMITYAAAALNSAYVLPVAALSHVRDGLRSQGKVTHGYMGIELTTLEAPGAPTQVAVAQIAPGSPAAEAGLRRGDHILKFNGKVVNEITDVRHAAFFLYPGQIVSIELKRGDKIKTLSATIGAIPADNINEVSSKGTIPEESAP